MLAVSSTDADARAARLIAQAADAAEPEWVADLLAATERYRGAPAAPQPEDGLTEDERAFARECEAAFRGRGS